MISHFHRLCDDLPMVRERVAALDLPTLEADGPLRFAIVGYAYHRHIESWGRDEVDFVDSRRSEVADFGSLWVEFVCLASGYLLGMFQAGRCSDSDCCLFESQLPGFMWRYSERFTAV